MKNTTVKNYNSDPPLYSVTSLKEWQTRDGGGYQGHIMHKTKGRILTFHNDGDGGCDSLYPAKAGDHDAVKEFVAWAEAHPCLPALWQSWGFEAKYEVAGCTLNVMIAEYAIAKEVKKGYLVYQMPDDITNYCGAKIGRKKAKADEPTLAWLTKEVPTAICRNVDGPTWSDSAQG